jgi:alkylated DNA repair protein (DNA oxidative demethylase)
MSFDLFDTTDDGAIALQPLADGAALLRRFAIETQDELLADLSRVIDQSPLRQMITPGGLRMSVAMTNCGPLGWVSDRRGYRYDAIDPLSVAAWPDMPASFRQLATQAAAHAGFSGFSPDACLINRYAPGAKLSLHQDRDERDMGAPIVSVSLGLPATFLFGGLRRSDKPARLTLRHGDVVVWGGPSRLRYHGVMPVADLPAQSGSEASTPLLDHCRINLTFRKAG